MDMDAFFSDSKWAILSELSKNQKSPIELANIFKTSIANISQQLRLMEAAGIVGKTKIQNSEKGKPRTKYYIKDETYYLVRLGKNNASKQLLKPEAYTAYIFNVLSIAQKKDHYFFLKFFWDNYEILSNASIGIFKTTDKSVELFVITEELEKARKKISNQDITNNSTGQTKRMICWSHNSFEAETGIKNNDQHFINLTMESTIILDEKGVLEKYKGMVGK